MPVRSRRRFDDGWRFFKGKLHVPHAVKAGMLGGLADAVARKGGKHLVVAYVDREMRRATDPLRWPAVTLPHDWVVAEPVTHDPHDATHGFRPHGIGWYRKVFNLPARAAGGKTILEFDGVFRNSSVWMNGHHLADHRSGYTSFHVDVTDVARYGAEGPNCVLVKVDARENEGWWYEGGGIYRHVWLTTTHRIHVRQWGTSVTTPRVTRRGAAVVVRTELMNETRSPAAVSIETVIVDGRGRRAARATARLRLGADRGAEARQTLRVPRPRLWSPASPALYRALTTLRSGGRVVDRYATTFGIRTIRFDGERGFHLNGVRTLLKGACCHQDFAGVGVALPDSLHAYKLALLKEMGCNAYRCAHHPPAPELLDAADRLGVLVMDENRKLDASAEGLRDLKRMLYRDRNHPSVVMWSLENEEPLEGTVMGARIVGTLARLARRIDPTRPTLSAMNHGDLEGGYAEQMDLKGFNYGTTNDKDAAYHRVRPRHPVVGTETNASVTTRGAWKTDLKRHVLDDYGDTQATPPWPWNTGFDKPWRSILKHPFLCGMFIWSGFDYRGEPLPFEWPQVSSHYGVMDTGGIPKSGYWYHRAMFRPDQPVLRLIPHWNLPLPRGAEVKVRGLTNLDRVDLFVNGRAQGRRDLQPGAMADWTVRWEPGELLAVGYRNGFERLRTSVRTTGPAAAVRLETDRTRIKADGMDAVVVRASVADREGRVVPTAGNLIRFGVAGPARVIGVGNGNPSSHEADAADRRRTFNGWCVAIVQSAGRCGRITLTARSAGLAAARLRIVATGRPGNRREGGRG